MNYGTEAGAYLRASLPLPGHGRGQAEGEVNRTRVTSDTSHQPRSKPRSLQYFRVKILVMADLNIRHRKGRSARRQLDLIPSAEMDREWQETESSQPSPG